jgi:hypothetical protein
MTRNRAHRAALGVALAAAAVAATGVPSAQAQTYRPIGSYEYVTDYYANAAHTGQPVGYYIWGWCPNYFTLSGGTRTAYSTTFELACDPG